MDGARIVNSAKKIALEKRRVHVGTQKQPADVRDVLGTTASTRVEDRAIQAARKKRSREVLQFRSARLSRWVGDVAEADEGRRQAGWTLLTRTPQEDSQKATKETTRERFATAVVGSKSSRLKRFLRWPLRSLRLLL